MHKALRRALSLTAVPAVTVAAAAMLALADCGYVHMFVSDSISMWDPDGGYPDSDTA